MSAGARSGALQRSDEPDRRASSDRDVLIERAQKLALPAIPLDLGTAKDQLLVFSRGPLRYALDLRFIREVVALTDYTALPFTPDVCLGLACARGELLALFDLPALDAPTNAWAPPRYMLLCGTEQLELALAADEALELVEPRALRVPPAGTANLVSGVDERGFQVIDGAALLSDPRLAIYPMQQESTS